MAAIPVFLVGLATATALVVASPPADVAAAAPVADTPVGFASVAALGQDGTTGGAAGPTVTVSTAADLEHYAGQNTPYTILVDGRITFDDMITVVADKSIIGVGATAEISGGGLQMGSTTRPGNNVIVRNLRFTDASDDSISVTNSAHHVWIDHNEFSSGYDGLLDIKRASDYVTVSWNHFHDHGKTALVGHSDTYTDDVGHLRVTYHHNFFDGTDQRHPRVRFGDPVHVFNNYYLDNSLYGVASTMDAGVLVEGNYFQNVAHPSYVGYDDSGPGRLVERNNVYVNSGAPETAGTVVEPRTYYDYTLDDPADVPAIVRDGVGVGRTSVPSAAANTADGFAGVSALGQNGTTGGAGGPVVTVATTDEFLDHIARPGPYVIQVSGTITLPTGSTDGMHDVTSDKTIVGLGDDARLVGGGLNIGLPVDDDVTTPPPDAVHNVVIRNLSLSGATDDLINVQMFSHHIWIDHNDLSDGDDGAIDIKRGADFVTVSWNRFHDHDKTLLLGHDDDNAAQDTGRLRVTYHHNFFDGSDQRNPRVRFAEPVHVYNNYYVGLSYGIASTMDAGVVAEGNYFDTVNNPGRVDFSGDLGRMVARDNILVDCNHEIETRGTVVEPRTYYSYTAEPASSVPDTVPAGAGVGTISAPAAAPASAAGAVPTGFAGVDALGQNGTTGGAGGDVVTATTTEELLRHIDTIGPLVIQVSGRIAIDSKQGVRPNKTVVGLGTTAEITGGGLDFHRSYNVIVRNITFTDAEDDAVNVGQDSHHIWIDHNEFVRPADGAIDVVRGADYVTVSWNWFRGTDKTMLIGHSDGNASEDTGHLKVTIHHNYFDGSTQRHPRVRFGEPVHVFNNYYRANRSYGVATTMDAGVLVEGNHFEDVPNPVLVGYADSGPGRAVERDNVFVGSGTPQTAGTVIEPSRYYSYTVDNPATVPATVLAGAGVGKV